MDAATLLVGNWKMNGVRQALTQIDAVAAHSLGASGAGGSIKTVICPPFTLIAAAATAAGEALHIGAQDCHTEESGAFTGEVSAAMIADAGGRYCIVGHSERRAMHREGDALVRAKAAACQRAGLVSIVCVGESLEVRREGRAVDLVLRQLAASLPEAATPGDLVIAYEPIWAIGTGETPTAEDIDAIHGALRQALVDRFGAATGGAISLLYGGSVKPGNAAELLASPYVNGALVGGASLKAADFLAIRDALAPQ